jgi:hypothetical protein
MRQSWGTGGARLPNPQNQNRQLLHLPMRVHLLHGRRGPIQQILALVRCKASPWPQEDLGDRSKELLLDLGDQRLEEVFLFGKTTSYNHRSRLPIPFHQHLKLHLTADLDVWIEALQAENSCSNSSSSQGN